MKQNENSTDSRNIEPSRTSSRGAPLATRTQWLVSLLVLGAFVLLVQWYLGWGTLLAPWSSVPLALALAGLLLSLASYVVRALRIYFYFRERMQGRLSLCVKLTWYHNFFNYVLPMRAGELAFPVLMSRYFSIDVVTSIPVLLWFRMLDLHTLILAAIFALPLLDLPQPAVAVLAAAWLSLPWLGYRFGRRLAGHLAAQRKPWRTVAAALAALPQDDRRFFAAWAWTLANWVVKLLVVAAGIVLFVDSPQSAALAAAVAGEVSMVLPFHSVAGTGTYEAALAAVLVPAGVPFDAALAGAINLHLFLILGVLITGMIALLMPARRDGADDRGGHSP